MNEIIISARDLHKVYYKGKGRVEALRGMDIQVNRGQSLMIVGPSGAGKSTLLHMLGGLLSPTVGSVYFEGMDLYSLSDKALAGIRNKKMGFVFQFYHLLPEFNAVENIMLPALLAGLNLKKRAEELLEMVGLGERKKHRPSELSGGEAQRVAIARALINNPDLLLCDEPTGNLDSRTGNLIYKTLWRINKEEGKTLIAVTHNEAMREDFDRVCYIRDGSIEEKEHLWV